MAETLGITVAVWSPLADGILSGKFTRSRSPAVIPILGARRLDQLLDNLSAASLELPADTITRLDTPRPGPAGPVMPAGVPKRRCR